jgi:hypothetical protein
MVFFVSAVLSCVMSLAQDAYGVAKVLSIRIFSNILLRGWL